MTRDLLALHHELIEGIMPYVAKIVGHGKDPGDDLVSGVLQTEIVAAGLEQMESFFLMLTFMLAGPDRDDE